ncbi:MAG: glycosyltransferase family 2 protein [Phycisphaerales bacterium]|nr:MAG: glycosyltransferase family 2 protein [Phycisphaerales bacterium]
MKLAIVIPAYNERALLPEAVARLDATPPPKTPEGAACERILVIVDDGSTDGTRELISELGERDDIIAVMHQENAGKGAAIRTGFTAALDAGADILLIQDADLEYDPRDHDRVLEPILDGRADAVIGSRFIGQTHRVLYFWHYAANRFITLFSNILTNLNLSDIECCSKAMTAEVARRIEINEKRFGLEPEIVAKLSQMRLPQDEDEVEGDGAGKGDGRSLRIYEVAVSYAGRTYAEGKKITWRDGISALRCIIKYNFRRLLPF